MKRKIISKASLQKKIKLLEAELASTKEARDAYGNRIIKLEAEHNTALTTERNFNQNMLDKIAAMLDDNGICITSYMGVQQPKASLSGIAFRIGELMAYKKEFFELKDRTLPVPKMKLVEDEHNRNKRQ